MQAHHQVFHFRECTVHYRTQGTGHHALLLFHGFGQDHRAFQSLASNIPEDYTLYFFDLFFHGESTWGYGEQPLTPSFWHELFAAFLEQHAIGRFSLAGFSIGARFALASFTCCPDRVDNLLLLAPDGIGNRFWYWLATYPWLTRKFFKSMILHPGRFRSVAFALREVGLLNKRLLRFAESQMNTAERRERVYYSWVVFRKLNWSARYLAARFREYQTRVIIGLGAQDVVIGPRQIRQLTHQLPSITVINIPGGHHQLIQHATDAGIFTHMLTGTHQKGL